MCTDETPAERAALLRLEVGRFREREHRRRFDLALHVGVLGGTRASFVVPAAAIEFADRAVRLDWFCALLEEAPPSSVDAWLTRPGDVTPTPLDTAHLASATAAFATYGRTLHGFHALTRQGWLDVRTGRTRVWKRLRLVQSGGASRIAGETPVRG